MKNKIFNAYTGFVLGLVVVTSLTFFQLPCPVCGGTGTVTGAKTIQVVGVDAKLVEHYLLNAQCGWDYERYTYDLKLTVENTTSATAFGTVMVTFHNPEDVITMVVEKEDEEVLQQYTGKSLEEIPVFLELSAHSTQTFEKTLTFDGVSLELFRVDEHEVEAYTEAEFKCPFHGEKAVVSFTEWLRLKYGY